LKKKIDGLVFVSILFLKTVEFLLDYLHHNKIICTLTQWNS